MFHSRSVDVSKWLLVQQLARIYLSQLGHRQLGSVTLAWFRVRVGYKFVSCLSAPPRSKASCRIYSHRYIAYTTA